MEISALTSGDTGTVVGQPNTRTSDQDSKYHTVSWRDLADAAHTAHASIGSPELQHYPSAR
jgi:hypothetical protein